MADGIVRTVYSGFLQSCQLWGLPFEMKAYTTLNEKFNIMQGIAPTNIEMPRMRYIALGRGGHTYQMDADGTPIPMPKQHKATDAAAFNHIPFVLREVTNDLTLAQRALYGLRREEVWNGVRYYAYYLRRLDLNGIVPQMLFKTVDDAGNVVTTPFVPNSDNLNPQPQDLSPEGVNVLAGEYVTTSALISLTFTAADVKEILDAANILYGDRRKGLISEFLLVSGVDKVTQVTSNAAQINFNETICAQVCSFVASFYQLIYHTRGFDIVLDGGSTEPLYKIDPAAIAGRSNAFMASNALLDQQSNAGQL